MKLADITGQISELYAKTIDWFVRDLGIDENSEGVHLRTFTDTEDIHIYQGDACKGAVKKRVILTASGGLRFITECFKT